MLITFSFVCIIHFFLSFPLKVTFLEDGGETRGSDSAVVGGVNNVNHMGGPAVGGGRQLVPGLIMMPDGSALHGFQQVQPQGEPFILSVQR